MNFNRNENNINDKNQKPKTYLEREFFVPLRLKETIEGLESKNENKILYIIVGMLIVFIFAFIFMYDFLKVLLGLRFLPAILLWIILYVLSTGLIISKFVYNEDEEIRSRVKKGRENKNMNLNSVWGIYPNGIKENYIGDKRVVTVNYGEEALILKINRMSVYTDENNREELFYQTLTQLDDFISKNGLSRTRIETRFNPENDMIWDYKAKKLEEGIKYLGPEIIDVMMEINNLSKFISSNHDIKVIYYIITKTSLTSVEWEDVVTMAYNLSKSADTLNIEAVSRKEEFITLIKNYYGLLEVSVEEVESMTMDEINTAKNYCVYRVKKDNQTYNIAKLPEVKLDNPFKGNTKVTKTKVQVNKDKNNLIFTGEEVEFYDIYQQNTIIT